MGIHGNAGAMTLLTVICACGAVRATGSEYGPADERLRVPIGHVTPIDLERKLPLTLAKHGYIIVYEERTEDIDFYETQWKVRDPFDDERELGVQVAESRLIIRVRKMRPNYSVMLTVESRALMEGGYGWKTVVVTPPLDRFARDLARSMRIDMAMGIRIRSD